MDIVTNPKTVASPIPNVSEAHSETRRSESNETIVEELDRDYNKKQLSGNIDPLNWSKARKWSIVIALSGMNTIGGLATLMCVPAVPMILADFHTKDESFSTFVVSVWELGEGVGPFLIAPLSELFGRRPIWHIFNALFALCSIVCALSVNARMLTAFRFLNGLVLASFTLCPAIISDMFIREERALAMAIAAIPPVVGPTFGPMLGSAVVTRLHWRWVFWLPTIVVGVFEILSFFLIRETYRPKLLEQQRKLSRNNNSSVNRIGSRLGPMNIEKKLFSPRILLRPIQIWVQHPATFILALFSAVAYGEQYLVFTTVTEVLESIYNFSTIDVGISYIPSGVASIIGMIFVGKLSDRHVKRMKALRGGEYRPEDRLPFIITGSLAIASGLLLYGWTAQKHVKWPAAIAGTSLIGFGIPIILISTQTFLVDSFVDYAASASASGTVLRSVAGALIPLAGPPLYKSLGLGWGNSILALVALVLLPIPLLLMRYGRRDTLTRKDSVNM